MNLELQKQLFDKYPLFYRKPADESDSGPLDYWGIEVGDGWYELLDQLSATFEEAISDAVAQGMPIFECPRAGQIKEKFGQLRVYVGGHKGLNPSVVEEIANAERKSSETCESCGKPGSIRREAWIHVACDECESLAASRSATTTADDLESHLKSLRSLLENRAVA